MPTPSTFGERLSLAMVAAGLSDETLATKLRMTRGGVNHWQHGRRAPGAAKVELIAAALGVRSAWLAFGDGEMTETADAPPPTTKKRRPKSRSSKPDVRRAVAAPPTTELRAAS